MRTLALLTVGLLGSSALFAQEPTTADSTGLPGDNFSLQGALDLFKRSKDLASFEKALNNADNKVNNLDLNGDGEVDYVRVVDNVDASNKDVHAIALRVPINKDEAQDVAVIGIERKGPQDAVAQIKGDEDLYGPDMIVEASEEKDANMKGAHGPMAPDAPPMFVVVNVWGWPCVQWFWGPSYVFWDSPWYWGYYPPYWHPWRPYGWRMWWGWNYHYRPYYNCVHVNRVVVANRVYAPRRVQSRTVIEHRTVVRSNSTTVRTDRNGRVQRQSAQQGHEPQQKMDATQRRQPGQVRQGGDRTPARNGNGNGAVRAPRGGGGRQPAGGGGRMGGGGRSGGGHVGGGGRGGGGGRHR